MADLTFHPRNIDISDAKVSFGSLTDFVSGLTIDPSSEPRPSLSEYFTSKGVDAGLEYHDDTIKMYAEANPWSMSETSTPLDGQSGNMQIRDGSLTFGANIAPQGEVIGYVTGHYSITNGHSSWTQPETVETELDVYDDNGYVIGTEIVTDDFDGYHAFDNAITTLSLSGYADTAGDYNIQGGVAHDRTITISDHEFGLHGAGAIGIDSDYGKFAELYGQMNTILHEGTGTYGYVEGNIRIADNNEFNVHTIETGVITSALNSMGDGLFNYIPPVKAGLQYDGDEVKPTIGVGINF